MKTSTAIHEAAHFLAFYDQGRAPRSITILPDPGSLGHCMVRDDSAGTTADRISLVFCLIAGGIAANKFRGHPDSLVGTDYTACERYMATWPPEEQLHVWQCAVAYGRAWVQREWVRILRLAKEVSIHKRMTIEQVRHSCPGVLNKSI